MQGRFRMTLTMCAAAITLAAASGSAEGLVSFDLHDIRLVLDVPSQKAAVTDQGQVQVEKGWNLFLLSGSAKISSLIIDGKSVDYHVVGIADTAQLPPEVKAELPKLDAAGEPLLVFFEAAESRAVPFEVAFEATFADPVETVQFSREKVGNEVRGTIIEQGAYLSPSAYFYPIGDEQLANFRVTVDLPPEWLAVSDGNPISSVLENFENPYANDGLTVMAAPYVARVESQNGVEVACYFFEADTSLAQGYLDATFGYLSMYGELIGPYPFERFTIAENFFPTGYGFPGWTLLGQQVLRLPFIKSTSLGHEVLHNWWGNSVYVDYERGNWCEGLTVYGADYRYKLMESPEAARDYRKDILKDYASYVDEGNDFPLREFKSRTSAETRTIGYNKAMMVFHMIEEEIGTQAFFDAWKLIYERYKAKQVSWEDWIAAYQETSGQDLSWVIPEWIDRAGAPVLELKAVETVAGEGRTNVRMDLRQDENSLYRLRVLIRFAGAQQVIDTFIVLDKPAEDNYFYLADEFSSVEIDPDYHLFRKLYPEEIEPIISAVMGTPKKRFVAYDVDEATGGLFQAFAAAIAEDSAVVETPHVLSSEPKDYAPVLLNPAELPDNLARMFTATDSSIVINSTEYARAGHTFVLSGKNWEGFASYLVVLTEDPQSLPRLGQLIPHYGKYSYLVFEGARNVGKGQWAVAESPLRRELSFTGGTR